jgi:hypothetical protein
MDLVFIPVVVAWLESTVDSLPAAFSVIGFKPKTRFFIHGRPGLH